MSSFTDIFNRALYCNGILQYAEYAERFEQLAKLLRETNEKYNLTAITDDEGMAYKHFADCLLAASRFSEGATVADVGCGGGFPTLPLAIVRPDLHITAIDSTAKKLGFIREAAEALSLDNVTVLCGRAEELGRGEARESFDVVTARAVARLNILLEWCVPLVRVGGTFIALKGKDGAQELAESAHALKELGCSAVCEEYILNAGEEQARAVITVTKKSPTPDLYPRAGGRIKKKPL